jgi:vanillate O-demethylase ferredoxin subunit
VAPGAHVVLRLGDGLVRQYSTCNGPGERSSYTIAVKREPNSRGGSAAVHRLKVGDVVSARDPANNFQVDWSAPHLLLLAGGIGITPLLSMARHALERGHSFELHYFTRTADHIPFREELIQGALAPNTAVHPGIPSNAIDGELRSLFDRCRNGTHVYVCGPRPFMDRARATADSCPAVAQVRWESFEAGAALAAASSGSQAIAVTLARSGKTLAVPAHKSILQVLLENGVDVDSSCMEGVCGLCATAVLDGEPDHRDDVLTPDEKCRGRLMTVCVSRAQGDFLTLDL